MITLRLRLSLLCLTVAWTAPAMAASNAALVKNDSQSDAGDQGITPSLKTLKGARILEVTIPAPRGEIVDRVGRPLAQSRVAYFPALKFPDLGSPTDAEIAAFGQTALAKFNAMVYGSQESALAEYKVMKNAAFVQHYHNRRWLPFLFLDRFELSAGQKKIIETSMERFGLIAHPGYVRHYPKGTLASHIIGYVGIIRPMPTHKAENGDPIFYEWEGRSGLEASLDDELRGTPGKLSIVFDANGKELQRDMLEPPIVGNTVVLTLDAHMQALANEKLHFRCSMVVMDAQNGEILAMASRPGFDLNDFIPSISGKKFKELSEDPYKPLYGRAFKAAYPPASTFKVPIAIAALKEGKVKPFEKVNCPGRLRIGKRWKKNWTSANYGPIPLRSAIKLSCNTWFYTVGIRTGSKLLVREARNFGFGQPTGIPLDESPGILPTNAWMMDNRGHPMYSGDVANFAIGQGDVAATPLQVAQGMTGIANGKDVWRARLVKQIQNHRNEVIKIFKEESIGRLEMSEGLLNVIRQGMVDVVHADNGTGKQAYCKQAQVAGKTGTAQWKNGKRMTWFAGYVPANDPEPQFAFAISREGGVSGGKSAAPICKNYFTALYNGRSEDRFSEVRTPGGKKLTAKSGDEADSSEKKRTATERTKKRRSATKKPIVKPKTVRPAPKKKRGFLDIFRRKR